MPKKETSTLLKNGTRVIVLRDPDGCITPNSVGYIHHRFKSIEDDSKDSILYAIDFKRSLNQDLHDLRGKIKTKTGWYVSPNNVKEYIEPEEFSEIKDEEAKFFYLRAEEFFNLKETNLKNFIRSLESSITSLDNDIASYKRAIESCKKESENKKEKLEQQKEILENNSFNPLNDFVFQILSLKKHKKISEVIFDNKEVIVITKPLTYTHKDSTLEPFEIGKFAIKYSLSTRAVNVVNLSKRFERSYHHPCIPTSTVPCLGSVMKESLYEYEREGDMSMIFFSIISFIEKPDYENPYKSAALIQFAQEIDESVYTLNQHFMGEIEKIPWDYERFESEKKNWLEKHPGFEF